MGSPPSMGITNGSKDQFIMDPFIFEEKKKPGGIWEPTVFKTTGFISTFEQQKHFV